MNHLAKVALRIAVPEESLSRYEEMIALAKERSESSGHVTQLLPPISEMQRAIILATRFPQYLSSTPEPLASLPLDFCAAEDYFIDIDYSQIAKERINL